MNARRRVMAIASLLLASAAAQAGEHEAAPCPSAYEASVPLTLPAAVDLALCRNAQVHGAWAGIRLQAAGLGEARAAFLPTLNAGLSRVHDRTAYPGASTPSGSLNSNTGSLSFSWRLFDFGGRAAGQRSAQAMLDAALANRDAVLQKTLAA
ncbi:MAG: TolC family protein, partial [Janthinobacterium sp.]